MNINFSDFTILSTYIKSYGMLAPAITFLLFVFQAAFPVFPYFVLAAAGGLLFGFKLGFALAWVGALVGASLAYWACRLIGTDKFIKFIESRYNYDLQKVNTKSAFWSVVIARIFPVVPTPLINVAAALGGMSFWSFFFSSAIGKIPTAILYTGLGLALFRAQDINTILIIIGAIILIALLGKYFTKKITIIS